MKTKYDNVALGSILGFVMPLAGLFMFYKIQYNFLTIIEFINRIVAVNIHTELISLFVIINLLIFFIFIWLHAYFSARGVLLSTFIYAGIVIFLKYIF